eukprot:Skav231732  [mRNA]  locus=scaffold638:21736:25300:+ [translate_table: standard]
MHIAGPPCVDWSTMGRQQGRDGPTYRHFAAWCAMRREYREPVVVMENVKNHDHEILDEVFSPLYTRQSILTCPSSFGFPTRRPRRFGSVPPPMSLEQWFTSARRAEHRPSSRAHAQRALVGPLTLQQSFLQALSERELWADAARPDMPANELERMFPPIGSLGGGMAGNTMHIQSVGYVLAYVLLATSMAGLEADADLRV